MSYRPVIFVGLLFLIVAIAYQKEVPSIKWTSTKSVTLKAKLADAFNFITNTDHMTKWIPLVARIREADSRPLGVGKKYLAVFDLPFLGEYVQQYKIVEFEKNALLVSQSDSYLKPRIEVRFEGLNIKECKMIVSISYQRPSYLFQYTLGPVLYFITSQRLQHSLFLLSMIHL